MSNETNERELERQHLLRTLVNYGPMRAAALADRANEERDSAASRELPTISRRGIGQKLTAMWSDGLVTREWQEDERLYVWAASDEGRRRVVPSPGWEGVPRSVLAQLAEEAGYDPADHA